MAKQKPKKKVLFIYVTNEQRKFIVETAKDRNRTLSDLVGFFIESAMTNRANIPIEIPTYVKQTSRWLEQLGA